MKLIKFLFKFILFILILICVILGIVIYQVYDNSLNEPDYLKNLETVEIKGNELVSKGIKDSETTNAINLTFEEKEMNILLKTLSLDLNKKLKSSDITIEAMYLDVKDSHDITFISYFDIKGFKTSLKGDFILELKDEVFVMTIDNFTIGKMSFEKNTVSSILTKLASEEDLKSTLEFSGITVNTDLSKFEISFNLLDLKELISYSKEDTEDLYHTLMDIFFRVENLITLSDIEDNVGIKIDLTSFSYDESKDTPLPYELDLDSINDKVELLLNNNIFEPEGVNNVATYLVKGYVNSTEDVKNYIANLDLSSIGIENNELYLGIIPYDPAPIENIFVEQIPELELSYMEEINNFEGFKLDEAGWNNFFAKTNAVGQVYSFVREEENVYKTSYIAIESMYIDIKNDHFALYLVTSINGKRITINFEMDSEATSGLRISSEVSSMRIGNDILFEDEIKKTLTFLSTCIKDKWIIIDGENKKIDFDFELLFDGSQELTNVMQYLSNSETSFVEEDDVGFTLIDTDINIGI